ncbi:CpxP superfamily protein [Geotalea daltonii FRC-32]|uniref:CpxP superfamily protein n=1 Tax=Geotalea daltonii (strain DSM 22248 / JCM 15807 / FRC-32) TaxID=316067 RepID=B9M676_GEODF|nr:Spy/CpxP family protein refolding chaperone [Geotalea daltonii]ACM21864.1 CpxP superfamily protein [Geotalea daltonii FRC-32]
MKKKALVAAVLVAMAIGGGTAVFAGRGPGGDCDKKQGSEMHQGKFYQRMAKVLKLTDAQQNQIKSLISAERAASEPFIDQMHEKRKLLMQSGESTTFDEASVRSIAAAIAQIKTELAVIRVKTQTQIYTILTPEQRELAKSLKPNRKHGNRSSVPGDEE